MAAGEAIPDSSAHSRWTAGRLARPVALALELSDVRVARLRARDRESPWQYRLRPALRGRGIEGVGNEGLHGPDERAGCGAGAQPLDGSLAVRRCRRLVWRLHGGLDSRTHDSLQGARLARRTVQPREHELRDRGALVPGV